MMARMAARTRPFPILDEDNRDFWEGARRHELIIKRCADCGYYIHYPKPFCPKCWSGNIRPARVSGRGAVFTYCVVRQQIMPGIPAPYIVALVEIEEQRGVRLTANLLDCQPEQVYIGMPVEVTFQEIDEELALPQFRPVKLVKQAPARKVAKRK